MAAARVSAVSPKPSAPPFNYCEACYSRDDVHYDRVRLLHLCKQCRDDAVMPVPVTRQLHSQRFTMR